MKKAILVIALLVVGSANAATHTVNMNAGFTPTLLEVALGDTVVFVNNTARQHSVTADPALAKDPANVILPAGAASFDSGLMQPGDEFTHVFEVEGSYQYVCLKHEAMGMIGNINVTDVSAANSSEE